MISPKRERHDGEIVAAQPQHRKAEQNAPERRQDAGERQQHPERQAEGFGQQRIGIGADRVKGDIAEIEQAGEADHDIEAPAEHHIDQDLDAEIVDPFLSAVGAEREKDDQRIGDDRGDGEGNKPVANEIPPCRRLGANGPLRAPHEPRRNRERVKEAAGGYDGDKHQ